MRSGVRDHLAGGLLEGPDELAADDLALGLRVGHPGQRGRGTARRRRRHQLDAGGGDEVPLDLLGLACPQQPVVDEHAGQLVADGPLHQRGGDRGVDPAGQPADHPAVADLRPDPARPARRSMLPVVQSWASPATRAGTGRAPAGRAGCAGPRGGTARRQPAVDVLERRDRRAGGAGDHAEARPAPRCTRRRGSSRPTGSAGRPSSSVEPVRLDACTLGAAVLAGAGVGDRAAERLGHRLEAVADAEHRHPGLEQRRVDLRRAVGVHAGRAAGQDDRRRVCWPASPRRSWCAARSREYTRPRGPGGRSAGRTGRRSRPPGPAHGPARPVPRGGLCGTLLHPRSSREHPSPTGAAPARTDNGQRHTRQRGDRADHGPDAPAVHATGLAEQVQALQGPGHPGQDHQNAEHQQWPPLHRNLRLVGDAVSSTRAAQAEPAPGAAPSARRRTTRTGWSRPGRRRQWASRAAGSGRSDGIGTTGRR